jgi:hypothetical protein
MEPRSLSGIISERLPTKNAPRRTHRGGDSPLRPLRFSLRRFFGVHAADGRRFAAPGRAVPASLARSPRPGRSSSSAGGLQLSSGFPVYPPQETGRSLLNRTRTRRSASWAAAWVDQRRAGRPEGGDEWTGAAGSPRFEPRFRATAPPKTLLLEP